MRFELTNTPSPEDAHAISQGIVDFNRRTVPDLEDVAAEAKCFVFVRDDAGAVLGGLRASCYWNALHVELVWLSDAARGSGAGRELLARAEAFALEHGCELALVQTTGWQARPFYEKCGYACFGTVEGMPRGSATHFLQKRLQV
ncbi:MAG: GNAT family N-acetyltransferase [Burkholderiaceae bacterium]